MTGTGAFGGAALLLTAGAIVMIFLVILGGTDNKDPLNQIYYLWADTSHINGAPHISEWTLWNVCSSTNPNGAGNTIDCGKTHAAYPFLPQQNFATTDNIPADFLNHHRTYYYLSRVTFAFYIISVLFMVGSLATGLLALCSRLGSAISSIAAAWSLFCLSLTAALMTAFVVLGRNAFHGAGLGAGIGVKVMAFTWGSVGCLLVATVLYCLGFTAARRRHRTSHLDTKEHHHRGNDRSHNRFIFFRRHRRTAAPDNFNDSI